MHIPTFKVALRTLSLAPLFTPWNTTQWTASDDTVRGGKSQSFLDIIPAMSSGNPLPEAVARFHGILDPAALGGSGFASQRTADDWPGLDVSAYDGIVLNIPVSDNKTYTLNLKDEVLPPTADGKEQSSVSWEYDFRPNATGGYADSPVAVSISFDDFQPTYRGRTVNVSAPLNLKNIQRINLMIRSFFAEQEGSFDLHISSVEAFKQ